MTQVGPGGIRIAVISAGGIPVGALGLIPDIILSLPALSLPALSLAMTVRSASVTSQGLQLHLAGRNVRLG